MAPFEKTMHQCCQHTKIQSIIEQESFTFINNKEKNTAKKLTIQLKINLYSTEINEVIEKF